MPEIGVTKSEGSKGALSRTLLGVVGSRGPSLSIVMVEGGWMSDDNTCARRALNYFHGHGSGMRGNPIPK